MQSWQRFTAIAIGIAALHGAALWAMARYTVQPQAGREPPAVVARLLQPPAQAPQAEAAAATPEATPVLPPKTAVVSANKSSTASTKPALEQAKALQAAIAKPISQLPSSPAAESGVAVPAKPLAAVTTVSTASTSQTPAAAGTGTGASTAAATGATLAANTSPKTIGIAAEPVYSVTPVYTMLMKGLEETGRVQISFEVDVNGQAVNARVAQSSGFSRLDDAALDAARKSRYKSALCGDKKVQSKYTRSYAFLVPALPDPPQPAIDCTVP
jgi:periplasmic protein TonB